MRIRITSPAELGEVIRSARKAAGIRIDDAAFMTGVSKQFTSDVEHGKPTVEFGRVLLLLKQLGIELEATITSEAMKALAELRKSGGIATGKDRWPPITGRSAATFDVSSRSVPSPSPSESPETPAKDRSRNEQA